MNKKLILAFLSLALICSLAWLVTETIRPAKNLSISVLPASASVKLDGQPITPGDRYVQAGKHKLVASLDGFADASQSFTISLDQPLAINLILNPDSKAGFDYLQNHPDEAQQRETLGTGNYSDITALQQKLYPIIGELPQIGLGYSVNYGQSKKYPNDPTKIALTIKYTTAETKTRALNWIRFLGYNPRDYEINYDKV